MDNTTLLKLQCAQLGLLIALSQGTKRWGERTVIMRKGKLVSVGGEIMPKDPPAYRILTPEQWMRFIQGDIKNFGDIERKQSAANDDKLQGEPKAQLPITALQAGVTSTASVVASMSSLVQQQPQEIQAGIDQIYANANSQELLNSLKQELPKKENGFFAGAKRIFDSIKDTAVETFNTIGKILTDTTLLKQLAPVVVEGLIAGVITTTGLAAVGLADIALFGPFLSKIPNFSKVASFASRFTPEIINQATSTAIGLIDKVVAPIGNETLKLFAMIATRLGIYGLKATIPLNIFKTGVSGLKTVSQDANELIKARDALSDEVKREYDKATAIKLPSARADEVLQYASDVIKDLQSRGIDPEQIKRMYVIGKDIMGETDGEKYSYSLQLIKAEELSQQINQEKDTVKKQDLQNRYNDILQNIANLYLLDISEPFGQRIIAKTGKNSTRISRKLIKEIGITEEQVKERMRADRNRKSNLPNIKKYTFTRRLKELQEIYEQMQTETDPQKLEELRLSFMWHKGLLQTDAKYGRTLDSLIDKSREQDKKNDRARDDYQELIAQLKKDKSPLSGQETFARVAYSDEVKYNEDGSTWIGATDRKTTPRYRSLIEKSKNNADRILELSNTRPVVDIGFLEPRSFQISTSDYKEIHWDWETEVGIKSSPEEVSKRQNLDSYINTGSPASRKSSSRIMAHEIGHAIERKSGLIGVSRSYIKSRSDTNKIISMSDIDSFYEDTEKAYLSDFTDPYTALDYGLSAIARGLSPDLVEKFSLLGTELVSTALQWITDEEDISLSLQQDREHILYGLWVLDYDPTKENNPPSSKKEEKINPPTQDWAKEWVNKQRQKIVMLTEFGINPEELTKKISENPGSSVVQKLNSALDELQDIYEDIKSEEDSGKRQELRAKMNKKVQEFKKLIQSS